MVSVFLVAAVATIVPALGALFYLLNRYEGYFEDARVFFSLIVGFFAGLVVAFLENVAFAFDSELFVEQAGPGTALLMFLGGYAFVESAAKTVVLGSGKFRRRKDTPYYGAALGIGFGAMLALQGMALSMERAGLLDADVDSGAVGVFALLLLMAVGTILTAGATGVWIGRGSAQGRLWAGLGHGALLTMPLLACLWLFRPAPAIVPAVVGFAYGAGLTVLTQRKVLDRIVPPEIRDQVRKERRREARNLARGEPEAPAPAGGATGAAPGPAAETPAPPAEAPDGPR